MTEFENLMSGFPDLFQFYHFLKFKQLLREDEDKKFEKRGERGSRVTNVNVSVAVNNVNNVHNDGKAENEKEIEK
jgi:hypothetical protein